MEKEKMTIEDTPKAIHDGRGSTYDWPVVKS
jgi:hypothetical protein